jgi:transglutaminase-like putative cysteine protease
MENVGGGRARPITTTDIKVSAIDERAMFTFSNPFVDFDTSTVAVPHYKKLAEGKTGRALIDAVHQAIVTTFVYDDDLAAKVSAGTVKNYVPVLDSVFNAKKGICYDYSSLLGGALRSQGIPTRLVMGYLPELGDGKILHAWNEIWITDRWVPVDATFDSAQHAAKRAFTLERDRSKAQIVKVY